MKKRLTACMAATFLAATAIGASVALTGCGGSGPKFPTKESDPTANISILLNANDAEKKFYDKYFAELAVKYNIKINFEGYETKAYYDRLNSLNSQGKLPDIFYVRPNEILQYKSKIFCLEEFKDSYNFTLAGIDLDTIYPLALDLYKYNDKTNELDAKNGELYAFPKDLSVQQLGYNKTLLEKYADKITAEGLTLPWDMDFTTGTYTWADYRKMCEVVSNNAPKGADGNPTEFGCDIPDIEILAKCYNGSILNTDNMKVSIDNDAVKNAIKLQTELVTPSEGKTYAAADYKGATQQKFQAGKVAFFGACASWEVGDYDRDLGKGNWDVMPWPTTDGSTNWNGKITSAGYVVSNTCKNWQVAMEIAASFMSNAVQERMVKDEKICIPLSSNLRDTYLDNTDTAYSPASRSVYVDVVSGEHGFRPATYSTFKEGWTKPLNDKLELIWTHDITTFDIATVQSQMQHELNKYKNLY